MFIFTPYELITQGILMLCYFIIKKYKNKTQSSKKPESVKTRYLTDETYPLKATIHTYSHSTINKNFDGL